MLKKIYSSQIGQEIRISYITSPCIADILEYVPLIDNIVREPLKLNVQTVFGRNILQSLKPDIFLNLQPSWKVQVLQRDLKARIYQYKKDHQTNSHAWVNFAKTFFSESDIKSFSLNDNLPLVDLPPSEFQEKHQLNQYTKKKIGLVHSVGPVRPHRAWTVDNWVALTQILSNKYELFLIGGPADKVFSEQILSRLSQQCLPIHDYTGQFSLVDTAHLLKSMDLVLGGDTGPTHLAASLGVKTIGLFGPTSAQRHMPFRGLAVEAQYECNARCSEKKCVEDGPYHCMKHIYSSEICRLIEYSFGEVQK